MKIKNDFNVECIQQRCEKKQQTTENLNESEKKKQWKTLNIL